MKKLLLLALLVPALAFAETAPPKGPVDPRVRLVDYNPLDVVTVTAFYGVSTDIQFAPGESVLDKKSLGTGDPKGWQIEVAGDRRILFLRPVAKHADTNLTVLTNKRVYHFALHVAPESMTDAKAWKSDSLTYSLIFRYPADEAAAREATTKVQQLTAELRGRVADVKDRLAAAKQRDENNDYWVAGAAEISPTEAHDDGRFIYLTFSRNRDMPAVYEVGGDGMETLVNTSVEGNRVIVQHLSRKLTLRKGDLVACVVNKSFDLDGGKDNTTGTIAPDVVRVIKGAQ
jgi:type IV secretion system protein VirB9